MFTLAGTLWAAARPRLRRRARRPGLGRARGRRRRASCSATSPACASGSTRPSPPGDYDWFGAVAGDPGTINEFPWFSFLLGDLHAHVLALPFTLLALGFALQVALAGPRGDARLARRRRGARRRARDRRAVRDQLVVVSRRGRACWCWRSRPGCDRPTAPADALYALVWLVLVLLASVVLMLPFWLNFDPAARGIGWVQRAPRRSRASSATRRSSTACFVGPLARRVRGACARHAKTGADARAGAASALAFVLSLLAPSDLAGVAGLGAAARRGAAAR